MSEEDGLVEQEAEATTAEIETEEQQLEQSGDTQEEEQKQKQAKGVQKRINELARQRYEAEQQAANERRLREELENRLKSQEPKEPGEPKEDDFDSYDDYIRALGRWEAKKEFETQRTEEQKRQETIARQQKEQEFVRRSTNVREKYEDFDMVRMNAILSDPMENAIINSESGPEVLYYLGNHVDESYTISQMDPISAAMALGKIEAKISLTPKSSSAPKPIPKIGSSDNVETDISDDLPMDEWMARRNKQLGQ